MKNYLYTFLALTVLSLSVHAQSELTFCDAVKKIKASQANFFEDLKGDVMNQRNAFPKAYYATFKVQGTWSTYISTMLDHSFRLEYGPYNTVEEGEKKAAELESEFLKCQTNYAFSKYRNEHNMISWVGYEQLKSGRRDRDITLSVYETKNEGKFYVELAFKGGIKDLIYQSCSGKADSTSDFGRKLFQVLQDVRSDFSLTTGRLKDTMDGVTNAFYETNVQLPGSSSCEIRGITGKEYSAVYYSGDTETEANKVWNTCKSKVLQTLGNAYEYTTTTDKEGFQQITFYHKDYYNDVKAGGVEVTSTRYKEGIILVRIKVHHNFMRL